MKNIDDIQSLAKFTNIIRKDEQKSAVKKVIVAAGVLAVIAAVAFCIYKFFAPDYMDDFDDEFEDDFGCDEDRGSASCFSKVKAGIRSVLPF